MAMNLEEELHDVDARLREIEQLCNDSDDEAERALEDEIAGDADINVVEFKQELVEDDPDYDYDYDEPKPKKSRLARRSKKVSRVVKDEPSTSSGITRRPLLKRQGHMDEEDQTAVNEQRGYRISKVLRPGKVKPVSQFECTQCDMKVLHISMMLDHVNAEHRKVPLECTECDFVTFKWKTLSQHRIKSHCLLSMKCPDCNFKGSVMWQMRQHVEEKHPGLEVEAFEADYSTKDGQPPPPKEKRPRNHGPPCPFSEHYDVFKDPSVNERYKGKRYRCRNCEHECSQRNNMMVHLNVAHFKQQLMCPWCEFNSLNAITLESHVRQKHKYKKRECMVPGCNYHSVEEGRFQEHLLKKHGAVYDETDHSIKIYN